MSSGELMRRLGLAPGTRAIVLNADDVGGCNASVQACIGLAHAGRLGSVSALTPASWFPAVARQAGSTNLDVGVHLTLTSEWADCRWQPVTGTASASLADEHGFFHACASAVHRDAELLQARAELWAQVLRARRMGVDVTHVDSHMLTLWHPRLMPLYVDLSRELRLANGLVRLSAEQVQHLCRISAEDAAQVADQLRRADAEGLVAFDHWAQMPLDPGRSGMRDLAGVLDSLQPGLTFLVCHPAVDSPELRAMASDWPARVRDHEMLRSGAWHDALREADVELVGMRRVRAAMFAD